MLQKRIERDFIHHHSGMLLLLVTAIIVLSSSFTDAAERYWNATSGDWSVPANWIDEIAPTSSDYAYIVNGGTANVIQEGDGCNYLYLGDAGTGTVQMNGGSFSAKSDYVGNSGTGTFTQNAGTNTVLYYLYLGYHSAADGTYNLRGTGLLSADYEYVGNSGAGTFDQSGGDNTISYNLYLGYHLGSTGTYNLSGEGRLDVSVSENIGSSGTGTFTQSGGINTTNVLYLGMLPGSSGTYNFTGGILILNSLDKGAGNAAFNFGGGTLQANNPFTTEVPMNLTRNGGDANIDTNDYEVALSGLLYGKGGLNKLGSGMLTLSERNIYSGDTTVNGGTLEIAGGIDAAGTSLVDVRSGKVVFKNESVNKTSLDVSTAANATFEVVSGTHAIGAINGSGITQIHSGANLTAISICQNTLTIGNGSKITIQPISGGFLGGKIHTVPEPSTWIIFAWVCLFFLLSHGKVNKEK
jgi:autotransporter-associated beta strand protein